MFSHVVSTNTKPHLSGVAKFGYLFAKKIHAHFLGFYETNQIKRGDEVLLSVYCDQLDTDLETQIWRFVSFAEEKKIKYSVFFHSWVGNSIEHELIKKAKSIYAGNAEIAQEIKKIVPNVKPLWSPSLIEGIGLKNGKDVHIFSFGMAFKIQTKYHEILAEKLEDFGIDYVVRFSTGFHERANFGNYDGFATELESIYGENTQFFGFLSDDAIDHFLRTSDIYVNFFPNGARANNTTLYAPMSRGCPVITNLDMYSPAWMVSGKNVLDISALEKKDLTKRKLNQISAQAMKDVARNTNWNRLLREMK
ncbi:MAG: hypothetical protein WAV30_05905 [Microgenomates group bacterium]